MFVRGNRVKNGRDSKVALLKFPIDSGQNNIGQFKIIVFTRFCYIL